MEVSEKCDVYSFGVVTLEVIMGRHPGDLISSFLSTSFASTSYDVLLEDVLDQRLALPTRQAVEKVFQLAFVPRTNIKQDTVVFRQNEEKLSKVLDIYEKRLGEARFWASDEIYLANLSHLPNTQYLVSDTNKGNSFTSRENVGRWWDEISSQDSWKKVVDLQKGA
ncbi:glutathione S-transferase F11-like [Quercus lobata]|uniref:glutathione S-transferase F11-like n=1 Tax=Quercus lobata TaxID=97700 RepID=UPI001246C59B|nr:glutathione S-transferase F11-like [Quercus lobata]